MFTGTLVNDWVVVLLLTVAVTVPEATSWPFWMLIFWIVGTGLMEPRGRACAVGTSNAQRKAMDRKSARALKRPSRNEFM
jgi:hypothetical protein